MDVTKLFDNKNDNIEPLELAKLDAMIEHAMLHPQIQVPANQNFIWTRKAMAVAAAVIIAVTVSFQFMPVADQSTGHEIASSANADDVYGEVSDLLMLETMSDLSSST